MTTAQDVFDTAMGLIDEVDEVTGATDTGGTREYKSRALFILNSLRGELYPYGAANQACPVIEDFETGIALDDFLCQTVMPYGLASHLLLDENPAAAAFFQRRYEELLRRLGSARPASPDDIGRLYGGIEYGEFSRW